MKNTKTKRTYERESAANVTPSGAIAAQCLTLANRAFSGITQDMSFEKVLRLVVDFICVELDWEIGHGLMTSLAFSPLHDELVSTSVWSVRHETQYHSYIDDANSVQGVEQIKQFISRLALPEAVLAHAKHVCIHTTQQEADYPATAFRTDLCIKGGYAFPIMYADQVVAVIELFSATELSSNAESLVFLESFIQLLQPLLTQHYGNSLLSDQLNAVDQASLVFKTDLEGKIVAVNELMCKRAQYTREEIIGNTSSLFRSDSHHDNLYRKMWKTIKKGKIWKGEIKNKAKDGTYFWLAMTIVPQLSDNDTITQFHAISYDITDKKLAEDKFESLSYYDPITLLPNRRLFKEHLEFAITQAKSNAARLAILFLDIDNFKRVNDSFGHKFGDNTLKLIGELLSSKLRGFKSVVPICFEDQVHTVCRLTGDEFSVLLSLPDDEVSILNALDFIKTSFAKPLIVEGRELGVTCSIGVSFFPDDGDNAETLLKNADTAMYNVKAEGKNDFCFYNDKMNTHSARKLLLEHELRKAIENNSLELYFQPKLNLIDGKIHSHEALLRWNPPGIGPVYPDEFIGLAEETNLIVEIGQWVLMKACQQTKQWQLMGYTDLSIAVNVSMRQFRSNLVDKLRLILKETDLDPRSLEIEITESTLMKDDQETFRILHEISDMGIRIAIDDFGTGYSSLRYLRQFPLDSLKIDRSFIMNCPDNEDDVVISNTIISLAKALNLTIVAEGVETEAQYEFVRQQGCDELQGYLISKPKSVQDMEEFMKTSKYYVYNTQRELAVSRVVR